MKIDISKWQKRNLWTLRSGELCVRPGLWNLKAPESGRTIAGGFSVPNSRTGEVWHYVVDVQTSTLADCTLRVYDENFILIQSLTGLGGRVPRDVTYGVIEDQLVIGSPDFPMLSGMVGSAVGFALQSPGKIPNRVLIDPPRGILTAWAGRSVVAGPDALYISDGLFPRTFDFQNALNPPGGRIYGVHVSAGGALIICTTTGVWGIPEDAATSGQVVQGVFSKLSDHATTDFGSTTISLGALWGLTDKGYKRIDTEDGNETPLDETRSGGVWGVTPITFPTYKDGRAFPGDQGPIFCKEDFVRMIDGAAGVESWWSAGDGSPSPFNMVGLLKEADGTPLFLCKRGILRPSGALDWSGTTFEGSIYGSWTMSPELSPVVRYVDVTTDSPTLRVSLNHETRTFAVPQASPVIDTDSWGGNAYREAAFRSRSATFAQRTDNLAVEVRCGNSGSRLGQQLAVVFKGPGKERRTG